MTTPTGEPFPDPGPDLPLTAVTEAFLDALSAQDFARLSSLFRDDVQLRALLPGGLREWEGRAGIEAAFTRWFGDTEAFEVTDVEVERIGSRLCLRWRVRLQADRLEPGWRVVEQQAYSDLDGDLLTSLSLVCTGYLAEALDA